MEISRLAKASYRLKFKSGVVVVNPDGVEKKLSADLVLGRKLAKAIGVKVGGTARREVPFIINEPGEYEVESISVFCYAVNEADLMYIIQADDLRVAYVGGDDELELDNKLIKQLQNMDVLITSINEKLVKEVEPTYLIPMVVDKGEAQKLIENTGRSVSEVESLNLNKATLPADASEVVLFV